MDKYPLEVTRFRSGMDNLQMLAQIQHQLHPDEPIHDLIGSIEGNTNYVAQHDDVVKGRVSVSRYPEDLADGTLSHRLTMVVAAADEFANKTEREQVQQRLLDVAEGIAEIGQVERLGVVADSDNAELLVRNGYRQIGSTTLNGIEHPVLGKYPASPLV